MARRALLALCLLVPAYALAGDATGTWVGSIQMDYNAIPKEYREKIKSSMTKMKITMTLKSDKSFTSTATGTPDGKAHTSSGTWKQSGSTVTVTTKAYDGKAKAGDPPRQLKMSADGKSMTMSMQAQAQSGKGKTATPAGAPTIKVIFKKK